MASTTHQAWLTVNNVRLEVLGRGQGPPIVWLHGEDGLDPSAPFLEMLVAPLGIKIGDRESRDIPDIFALPPAEVLRLQYRDPERAAFDPSKLSDDQLTVIARNREATALYAWEPYFHNPKLRQRLHRIKVPTLLVWGLDARFVSNANYGAAYLAAIPGAHTANIG